MTKVYTVKELSGMLKGKHKAQVVYVEATGELLGEFETWRLTAANPSTIKSSPFSKVSIGYSWDGNNRYYKDMIERLGLTTLHEQLVNNKQKDEKTKRAAAELIATPRLDAMEAALKDICARNSCGVSYFIGGDTHGIHEDYLYIHTTVCGQAFTRKIED